MKNFISSLSRIVVTTLLLGLFASAAHAQATRTWVSGVGDDANPCSRTAPCKTFAGAISKTAAAGVISVLDPGGFGAVTITKSITIENDGAIAGILSAGTNGVIVNVAATDKVILRNLSIDGAGTGLDGVRLIQAGNLFIEGCTINGVTQKGINFAPTGAATMSLTDTKIHNANNVSTGGAILIAPSGTGTANVTMSNVQMDHSLFGLQVNAGSKVFVRNSESTNNDSFGFVAVGGATAATLLIDNSLASGNTGAGVSAKGALGTVMLSRSSLVGNGTGIQSLLGGVVQTFGDNRNFGNTTPGAPTVAPTVLQ